MLLLGVNRVQGHLNGTYICINLNYVRQLEERQLEGNGEGVKRRKLSITQNILWL